MTISKTTKTKKLLKSKRTKETFKDKISGQSPSSIEGILQVIRNFENYSMEQYGKVDLIPDLKESSEEELYDILQSWINWNKPKAPRTVSVYFSRLRKYLHYFGIKLNEQDIKNELDFQHRIEEELYGLTLDDIKSIFKELRYKHKVLFICQLSSLMRIGEIVQLRKKHLVLGKKNIMVKIPPTIAKNSSGRTTFFSKEASKMLRPLIRNMDDDSIIFGSSDDKTKTAHQNYINSTSNAKQILRKAITKTGRDIMKYESTGRLMITTHSFRAYGITKLSRHDVNLAKKIAGQKGYLLQYDRMTDDEKLELYEKYELDLVIDDSEKQKAAIEKLEAEKSELEKVKESKKHSEELTKNLLMELMKDPDVKEKLKQSLLDTGDYKETK